LSSVGQGRMDEDHHSAQQVAAREHLNKRR
jgi:hypothetical protein